MSSRSSHCCFGFTIFYDDYGGGGGGDDDDDDDDDKYNLIQRVGFWNFEWNASQSISGTVTRSW